MTEFGTLYQAISVQKATLFLLFSLLIAVAAFNLVSGLIMIVEQRRGDIAILRSMGTSRLRVLGLFCLVGIVLGVIGTLAGIAAGLLLGGSPAGECRHSVCAIRFNVSVLYRLPAG